MASTPRRCRRRIGATTAAPTVPPVVASVKAGTFALQSTGQPVHPVSPEVCERTAQQYESGDSKRQAGQEDPNAREWRGFLKRLTPGAATSFRD